MRLGVDFVCRKILEVIGCDAFLFDNQAHFRFYGGWYEHSRPTRRCQSFSTEVQASFPSAISIDGRDETIQIKANAELAYALAAEPNKHLLHTYRKKRYHLIFIAIHRKKLAAMSRIAQLISCAFFYIQDGAPKPTALTQRKILYIEMSRSL